MHIEHRPNLFIVGAQKSGTSALAAWLREHSQVLMSYPKEPGYLAFGERGYPYLNGYGKQSPASQWVIKSEQEYLALFAKASDKNKILGEASTWYLAVPGTAKRIQQMSPNAKIVMILRNPVDRAYSAWSHARRDGHEPIERFSDAFAAEDKRGEVEYLLRYKMMGNYSEQLAAYQAVFPAEQLLVLFYDDLRDKPGQIWEQLCLFLDIAVEERPSSSQRYNRSGIPRSRLLQSLIKSYHFRTFWKNLLPGKTAYWLKQKLDSINLQSLPPMDKDTRKELQKHYRPDIQKLMAITERDLSSWIQ